mgnify:CR=1 FL=1
MSATLELLRAAQEGDRDACEQAVIENNGLIWSVVRRYYGRGVDPEDLYQLGCLGFLKAVQGFDFDYGTCFSTYAVPMCVGEVRRFLRDDNPVRVSRSMRDTAYKAMQVKEQLMAANGREPMVDEIAAKLGMKTADVVLALEAIVDPVSLYEPVYSDGGDTIYVMDQVGDANTDADWVDEMMIKDQIKQLDDRERNILYKRFMEGKTQMEVASEIGISQAQVSRLEKTALRRIKGK